MTSTNDIRRSFLNYFAEHGHENVASAPLVPHNDPTLMFVNAGMVPFKNIFTGLESRPYTRAASSQKCVRAGGKHNDLDNVGYTARHHTFFEMLGNFSFGDYFKEQAITHAWELVHKIWGLDKERLCVTVYHDDEEAFGLWRKIAELSEAKIIRIATNDNFWSMGDVGPCGPCSEIFYDHGAHIPGGPPGSADEDGDRFVEIWNLVFMQYEQQADGTRVNLPKPSIDTGMGLERIAAVLQGKHDNYDTDTFRALIEQSEALTHVKAEGAHKASHRVIADHLRASGFLIADGVLPSNEGRGYVLRRIMRRAMRHAHILGSKDPLMHRLVASLVDEMGHAYPELNRAQSLIESTLLQEETRFRRTLEKGLKLLEEGTTGMAAGDTLAGDIVFKLYDTYGFPYDLTEDALRTQNIAVDKIGFDAAMAEQKRAARAAWKGSGAKASEDIWFDYLEEHGNTEFIGYNNLSGEGKILGLVRDGEAVDAAQAGETVTLLVNQTPFYAESGGQIGDTGVIIAVGGVSGDIIETSKPLGRLHAHRVELKTGRLQLGHDVHLQVNALARSAVRASHSATHLLHAALRKALGDHVTQKGSLVGAGRLRFDFSHNQALTQETIQHIEADVNAQIRNNRAVRTQLMTPQDAIEAGAMALFGEKYGEEVRVLSMGAVDGKPYSIELCGGTHVQALGDIGLFVIIADTAVASGVRRIEALTGETARLYLMQRDEQVKTLATLLKTSPEDVATRVQTQAETLKKLEQELAEAKKAIALGGANAEQQSYSEHIQDIHFYGCVFDGLDAKDLRGLIDETKATLGEKSICVLVTQNEGKAAIAVGVSAALLGRYNAATLLQHGVAILGGKGGGGRPDMAQGGGPNAADAENAVAGIKQLIAETA
jgi:alanyl-tRNA synthetase